MDLDGTELREGYADVGDVKLHYVELGEGPLVLLLHGFPEFWFGWRLQIKPLAAAGFRVVAPNMRGYNLSSRSSTGSPSSMRRIRGSCRRDCTTRVSSGSPGTSSSSTS